jgi:hypothetical protein
VTCRTEDHAPEVVLSVVDVVASATDVAYFAVERRAPQVTVIELAEGTLYVPDGRDGQLHDISSPRVVELSRRIGDALEVNNEGSRPQLAPINLLSRRSIASLQIRSAPGVERVRVDGVDYGPLPLSLRRMRGSATIELIGPNSESVTQEVEVGFGPRIVELAALIPSDFQSSTLAPLERRVEARVGTLTRAQQDRMAAQIRDRGRRCYERLLKRDPNLRGQIRVRLDVSTSGQARRVVAIGQSRDLDGVGACIEQSLIQERFPSPSGGNAPVELIVNLSPQH